MHKRSSKQVFVPANQSVLQSFTYNLFL